MNQADFGTAASKAVTQSKNILTQQLDRQAASWGSTLSQTAQDLNEIGSQLGANSSASNVAQLARQAALYVDRAATYLSGHTTDDFVGDVEALSRERPWAVAASALALGFVAARFVKSSSARRYATGSKFAAGNAHGIAGKFDE